MKNNLKVIIGYVLAIVVIVGVIAMIYRSTSSKTEVITYDKVVAYFQKEEVREFEIDNKNNLTMLLYQYELDENGQPVTDENGNRVFKKRADGSPDTIRKTYKLARTAAAPQRCRKSRRAGRCRPRCRPRGCRRLFLPRWSALQGLSPRHRYS